MANGSYVVSIQAHGDRRHLGVFDTFVEASRARWVPKNCSIAMMCPFEPSEKQALLEAPDLDERARLLTAIVEMAALNPPRDGPGARH